MLHPEIAFAQSVGRLLAPSAFTPRDCSLVQTLIAADDRTKMRELALSIDLNLESSPITSAVWEIASMVEHPGIPWDMLMSDWSVYSRLRRDLASVGVSPEAFAALVELFRG